MSFEFERIVRLSHRNADMALTAEMDGRIWLEDVLRAELVRACAERASAGDFLAETQIHGRIRALCDALVFITTASQSGPPRRQTREW